MSEIKIKLPEELMRSLEVVNKTGIYKDKDEFLEDAINLMLTARKDVRLSIAVELYRDGAISLGRFAELAKISYEGAKKVLLSKGITIRRGPRDALEMKSEAKKLLEL